MLNNISNSFEENMNDEIGESQINEQKVCRNSMLKREAQRPELT